MYDERRRNGELAAAKRIGREEGREEGINYMLQKMLASGMDYTEIVRITGMTQERINAYLKG